MKTYTHADLAKLEQNLAKAQAAFDSNPNKATATRLSNLRVELSQFNYREINKLDHEAQFPNGTSEGCGSMYEFVKTLQDPRSGGVRPEYSKVLSQLNIKS